MQTCSSLTAAASWIFMPQHAVLLRRRGCMWLTMFPSVETATRLAALALDPATPHPVREQAIWSLGYRQVRGLHPATLWPAKAVQVADEALVKLADAATAASKITGEQHGH